MRIICIIVGKTTDKHLDALTATYVARTNHYVPFEFKVVPSLEGLSKLLSSGDRVVFLDERGEERSSVQFASWLEKRMAAGFKRLVLVTGGPYGFTKEQYALAHEMISLSRMTFSHQMIRLLLAEQVYRALTILRSEPYHHE